MPLTSQKQLSLKWLELFQICATKGSLQAASEETGLSVSTISHHIRSLEQTLGVELFNHSRRPLILTNKGQTFLSNIEGALLAIRQASAEASSGDIIEASQLRVGSIEDFDSDIMPELAVHLSTMMPRCKFAYQIGSSNDVIDMLRNRHLDIGITASPTERYSDLTVIPLLEDPFIVVIPKDCGHELGDIVANKTDLPFLRFSKHLMIARHIEAHYRRSGYSSPNRFECDNNQTLMAMVAGGSGWTISTPLLFARARRFQPQLMPCPYPAKGFSRTLSIVATPDCSQAIIDLVNQKMRALITNHAIGQFEKSEPWLADRFRLLD